MCTKWGGYKEIITFSVEYDVWMYPGCVGQTLCGSVGQHVSPSRMYNCSCKHRFKDSLNTSGSIYTDYIPPNQANAEVLRCGKKPLKNDVKV